MTSVPYYTIFAVFLTILISGLVGGIGGALLTDGEKSPEARAGSFLRDPALYKNVVLGILAAHVVPLFLVLASPGANEGIMRQLLNQKTEDAIWWSHLFVLMGFCIVAALAAQNFLSSVSQKVINQVRAEARAEIRAESNEVRRNFEQTEAKVDKVSESLARFQANPEGYKQQLAQTPTKLLQTFLTTPGSEFETGELARRSDLSIDETRRSLEDLRDRGLLEDFPIATGETLWSLTGWGKAWLRSNSELSEEDRDVLRAMRNAVERRPKVEVLSQATSVPAEVIKARLERLQKLGLVDKSKSVIGGWRLRSTGRDLVEEGHQ